MAALTATHPTLLDVSKRMDPDGRIDSIAGASVRQYRGAAGHGCSPRAICRQGTDPRLAPDCRRRPGASCTVAFSRPRTPPRRSLTPSGCLEAYAEVDKALADLNGNTAAFRSSEDQRTSRAWRRRWHPPCLTGMEGVGARDISPACCRDSNHQRAVR